MKGNRKTLGNAGLDVSIKFKGSPWGLKGRGNVGRRKYPREGSLLKGRRTHRKYAEQFNEVLNSYNFFLCFLFLSLAQNSPPVSTPTTPAAPETIPGQRPKTEPALGI